MNVQTKLDYLLRKLRRLTSVDISADISAEYRSRYRPTWESDSADVHKDTDCGKSICPTIFGRGLAIASLNINSLLSHIDELRVFMSSSKVDILHINESKLDSTVRDNEVYIPGFEIVRKDRKINGRNGGGVCTYVRTNLNYRIRNDLNNDLLECLFVEISKPRSTPFLVGTWYRPPSSPPNLFSEFENVIAKIDAENKELYLLGDINCNLLPEAITVNSSYLINIFDIYGLSQLITEPTRVTPDSKTLIDLCITNSPEKVTNSGVIHLGISDHSLVFFVTQDSILPYWPPRD